MFLVCPQCQSQYALDPAKLGAGRTVRCVSCGFSWFQGGAEGAVGAAPAAQESIQDTVNRLNQDDEAFQSAVTAETVDEEAEQRARRARIRAAASVPATSVESEPFRLNANAFGAVVFTTCLIATVAVFFYARVPMVKYWPRSVALYELLHLRNAEASSLRIADVAAARGIVDSTVLEVEATITNEGKNEALAPSMRVMLKGEGDALVKEWNLRGGGKTMAAGETVPIKLKLPETPAEGNTLEIRIGRDGG